jgi:hypothetical protein
LLIILQSKQPGGPYPFGVPQTKDVKLRRGSKWDLLKLKCLHSPSSIRILSSKSVPFRPTTVQMSNLALVETDYSVVAF